MPTKKKAAAKPSAVTKKKPAKNGMTPNAELIAAARSELPKELQGVAGITMLADGKGAPGQATPVKGQIKALVMPVDVPTLCVDTEGSAHDIVCCLADLRASVVKGGTASLYGVSRLAELMRRLNMGVERLTVEIKKQHRVAKA